MQVASLDLDLEVFQGPFDLLLTLVLKEEIDLLEVDLASVVLAYVEHLERSGELDLEAATEFLLLIAALLELKSRLMLPREEEELLAQGPEEAADELVGYLAPVRERYQELRPDEHRLDSVLAEGAERARAIASGTLAEVRARMGVGAAV